MILFESEKDERRLTTYLPRYAHIYSAKVGMD